MRFTDGEMVEFVMYFRSDEGQGMTNVFHYRVAASVGLGADEGDAMIGLEQKLLADYLSFLPQSSRYTGCTVRRIGPQPSILFTRTGDAADGLAVGDPLPCQIAGMIQLASENSPPRVRARKYLPHTVEANNDATGRPTAAFVLAMNNLGIKFREAFTTLVGGNGSTFEPVILHRPFDPLLPLAWVPTQSQARTYWATVRRRSESGRGDRPRP